MTDSIMLEIAGITGKAEILEESPTTSIHTGTELRQLLVAITVSGDAANAAVSEALQPDAPPLVVGGVSFTARQRMSSHTSGNAQWHYEIDLAETEGELKPDRLVIDGIELILTSYRERDDGGALIVECRATVDGPAAEALGAKLTSERPAYFNVERPGIQPIGREMRFGQCLWSQDGEATKHRLVLVERCYDEDHLGVQGFSEPQLSNGLRAISDLQETVERLLAILSEQNLLAGQTPQELLSVTKAERRARSQQYSQVDDADDPEWWSD